MNDARRTRVLLTRSAEDNADWARELRARGYEAVECASLVEQRLDTGPALARELEHADWIAFTSRRAVDASHDLAPRLPDRVRVAAVGPATEERVRERFGRCDSVSRAGNAADLGTELVRLGARHVVVAAARGGLFDVERALTAAGRTAARVELYEMTPTAEPLPPAALDVDAAFFASLPPCRPCPRAARCRRPASSSASARPRAPPCAPPGSPSTRSRARATSTA